MSETALRAMWFALFASIALILGGFALGYGTALLAAPSPESVPPPLPTLVPDREAGTHLAKVDRGVALHVAPGASPRAVEPAPMPPAATVGTSPTAGPPGATTAQGTGLAVTLEGFDLDLAQGGIEVVLQLHNNSHEAITFSFWPESDLWLADDQGHRYEMRWAEFEGRVTVPPKGGLRLVRAFFRTGPDRDTRYLTVAVEHPPQLPESRWRVPVHRGGES